MKMSVWKRITIVSIFTLLMTAASDLTAQEFEAKWKPMFASNEVPTPEDLSSALRRSIWFALTAQLSPADMAGNPRVDATLDPIRLARSIFGTFASADVSFLVVGGKNPDYVIYRYVCEVLYSETEFHVGDCDVTVKPVEASDRFPLVEKKTSFFDDELFSGKITRK